jgi:hypothetical protein
VHAAVNGRRDRELYALTGPVGGCELSWRSIFYLHTANIDRIWAIWQSLDANLSKYDGTNPGGGRASLSDQLPHSRGACATSSTFPSWTTPPAPRPSPRPRRRRPDLM